MKFPEPSYTNVRCPHCDAKSNISFRDGGAYWIGETRWTCPQCRRSSTTAELQEASEKVLVSPSQLATPVPA